MSLIELAKEFRKENVILWKESLPQSHAFGYLFDALVNGPVKFDPMPVWTDMQNRTAQGVYMGNGLLLPHARVKDIVNPLVAVGICPVGIPVPEKTEKAQFVVMVLSPLSSPTAHTLVVGKVARLILDKSLTASLLACKNSLEAYSLITA